MNKKARFFLGYGRSPCALVSQRVNFPHTIYTNQNYKNHACRTKRTKKYTLIFLVLFFLHWVPFPNEAIFHWGTSPNVIGDRSPMTNSKKPVFMRVCDFSVLYITVLPFLQIFKFGVQYGFQVKNHML